MYNENGQNTPSTQISLEVEAKVAKGLTGTGDEFRVLESNVMKSYYNTLKTGGTISSELRSQVYAELTKYAQILVTPQSEGGRGYTELSSELSSFRPEETLKYFESIYQSK